MTTNDMTTDNSAVNAPEIKNDRLKLILKGVSMSSLAKVWSSGMVDLKAKTAPI